jgi:monoamine oxidase
MQSRRDFITRVAAFAGTGVAYSVAQGLGVIEGRDAWLGAPALVTGSGRGCKVVILGAGPAGLSAAYKLGLAGYDCTLLEARERVGGRVWTIRRDTVVEMTDGSRQVCNFDSEHYLNAGAARIPSHHTATLGY